jgi:hypothetical protein
VRRSPAVSSRNHRNIIFSPLIIFLKSIPDVSNLPTVIFARQLSVPSFHVAAADESNRTFCE